MESDDIDETHAGNNGTAGEGAMVGGRTGSGRGGRGDSPAAGGGIEMGGMGYGGGMIEAGRYGWAGGQQGGAGGSPALDEVGGLAPRPEIVLAPDTLVFTATDDFGPTIVLGGYDPDAGVCARLVWAASGNELPLGATCFQGRFQPMIVAAAVTSHDGACTSEELEQLSQYPPNSVTGCIDASALSGSGVDLVDVVVEVDSDAFVGSIVADNRSSREPRPITLGLTYVTDAWEDVYVQSRGSMGYPDWVRVWRDGEQVRIFDSCLPTCDGRTDGSCADVGGVTSIMVDNLMGTAYANWDGYLYEYNERSTCETRTPAPDGTYQVEMCFGYALHGVDGGDWVTDPTCVTQEFTLPTDLVTVEVDYGG